MTAKHECSKTWVWSETGSHRCFRPATVQRDGQWWCWQHDPIRVEADKQKRRARWDARHDRETAKWERRTRNAKLAALVTLETAELLERLAQYANLYDAPESAYTARALAARIREALTQEGDDVKEA